MLATRLVKVSFSSKKPAQLSKPQSAPILFHLRFRNLIVRFDLRLSPIMLDPLPLMAFQERSRISRAGHRFKCSPTSSPPTEEISFRERLRSWRWLHSANEGKRILMPASPRRQRETSTRTIPVIVGSEAARAEAPPLPIRFPQNLTSCTFPLPMKDAAILMHPSSSILRKVKSRQI